MMLKATKFVKCRDCKAKIELHEYFGLEGGWYTSHHCERGDKLMATTKKTTKKSKSTKRNAR